MTSGSELHISEELGFDSNFDSSVEHLFVICDKSGVCEFSTSNESGVEGSGHCFGADINTVINNLGFAYDLGG